MLVIIGLGVMGGAFAFALTNKQTFNVYGLEPNKNNAEYLKILKSKYFQVLMNYL